MSYNLQHHLNTFKLRQATPKGGVQVRSGQGIQLGGSFARETFQTQRRTKFEQLLID